MPAELTLRFPSESEVNVIYDGTESGQLPFTSPIIDKDRSDIRWYVETYGAQSLADPDDREAKRIEGRLPEIGKALFDAVFSSLAATQPFVNFRNSTAKQRVLTICSHDSAILALPWELLHDPSATGTFLFRENPHISIRRTIPGATGGQKAFSIGKKKQLHLLFVVSRPDDAGFIDPRADPQGVLDAVDEYAPGRVTCEFLRPATLEALIERLNDDTKPSVDILHFDGHGVFMQVTDETAKSNPALAGGSIHSILLRERQSRGNGDSKEPIGIGFLVFEKDDRTTHLVSAQDLSNNLYQARVGLVVLSACQTATLEEKGDPMASVAGRLTATGIPAILAMTHSVLVATTRTLFGKFYASLASGKGIATALDDARMYLDLPKNRQKYEVLRDGERRKLVLRDWFVPALFHSGDDTPLLTRSASVPLASTSETLVLRHNLRDRHEAGFFGRRRELWDIAYWLGTGQTRRISITGFGGQGKTELAMEAGRWLLRTGMFSQAVLVDYAGVQSHDAVAAAVSTISATLQETLASADEVTEALARTATLLILDNLETIPDRSMDALDRAASNEDGGGESPDTDEGVHATSPLQQLLTAASAWSEAGGSRVLLTSRIPDFGHPDFAIEGTRKHRRIVLSGLGSAAYPDDALDWYAQLELLPSVEPQQVPRPTRDELIRLFGRVAFHPLSICVLVQQLKSRTAGQLEQRLDELLSTDAVSPIASEGTPNSLIASLQLSLERLGEEERDAARRLGVFQGGAFEDDLLAITELGQPAPSPRRGEGQGEGEIEQLQSLLAALESGDPRVMLQAMGMDLPDVAEIPSELLAQLTDNPELQQHIDQLRAELDSRLSLRESGETADATFAERKATIWPTLRRNLEAAALIEAERVPGVGPPFLRFHPTLAPMLWSTLDAGQREALLLAHRQRYYALAGYLYHEDRKNPQEARAIVRRELPNLLYAVHQALDAADPDAVEFVEYVNRFLDYFGMTREAASLTRRAEQAGGERGSRPWLLAQSGRGEQLLAAGNIPAAADIFTDIRQAQGEEPSYELAVTLRQLGRCYRLRGRPNRAEATYRQGIAVTRQLDQSDLVKRHCRALQTDLADVLADQGNYQQAREQYQLALQIDEELNELRGQGVILGQLGTLALREGDLAEAVKHYHETLALFQCLGESDGEAVGHHQLGMVYEEARQWELAEHHYRESARLNVEQDNLAGAAQTWNNLAVLNQSVRKPEAAESWYRKAIEGFRAVGDDDSPSKCLSNLADLLRIQGGRLDEARKLAEESLAIKQTLDPGAAEIWKTYGILAEIADQQAGLEQSSGTDCQSVQQAAEYRRLAREAKRNFAGTAHEMKRFAPVIATVVEAVAGNEQAQAALTPLVQQLQQAGGENADLADAIQRIVTGERDAETLCQTAGPTASMIIETILQALEDPSILADLLPPDAASE